MFVAFVLAYTGINPLGVASVDTKITFLHGLDLEDISHLGLFAFPVDKFIKNTRLLKEVNTVDGGGLTSKLSANRRLFMSKTGSLALPDGYHIFIKPDKFPADVMLAFVLSSSSRGEVREQKVKRLYSAYMDILMHGVTGNFRSILVPVLGVDERNYDSSVVLFALFSALTDITKTVNSVKEFCIFARTRKEEEIISRSFNSMSSAFGVETWYLRETGDFSTTDNLSVVVDGKIYK